MKYTLFIIFAICFLLQLSVVAQDKLSIDKTNNFNNRIGVAVGFSTSSGISYRYNFNNFGIQATILPLFEKRTRYDLSGAKYNHYRHFGIAGITGFYNFHNTKKITNFVYQSIPIIYRTNPDGYIDVLSMGFGTGIEMFPHKRFSINVMQGIVFLFPEQILSMSFEFGMYYCF